MTDDAPASDHAAPLADRVTGVLRQLLARTLAPGLYTVATPIGNLGDLSPRAVGSLLAARLRALTGAG